MLSICSEFQIINVQKKIGVNAIRQIISNSEKIIYMSIIFQQETWQHSSDGK